LIKARRPWRNANHVEAETATYLDWYNNRRLYEYCGDMPPVKCSVRSSPDWPAWPDGSAPHSTASTEVPPVQRTVGPACSE
jgi:transposase InsO family protein